MDKTDKFSMFNPRDRTQTDQEYAVAMEAYFSKSLGTNMDKLRNFPKYVPRQSLSLFLAKQELFQKILNVHGHIIECGVYLGAGLMTWANLSAIFEPYNHTRRIVGFDTFSGFPSVHEKDQGESQPHLKRGGIKADSYDDILEAVNLYDANRPIDHIPRIELVAGDAVQTISRYVEDNPHLLVALLYLDFDLYEPTKSALLALLDRMPKGSVLAFDELNQKDWPGETLAVLEEVGIRNLSIRRFNYTSALSYAVLE